MNGSFAADVMTVVAVLATPSLADVFILAAAAIVCIVIAAWPYAWRAIEGRRLRRQYEQVFGRPVPVGRTNADLFKILNGRRDERRGME